MRAAYRRVLYGITLAGMMVLAGCSGGQPPPLPDPMLSARIGANCTVYFRHDALGMASNAPASPLVGNHNGADTNITGKLLRMNAAWICVSVGKAEYTIPKEAILLVEMPSN